MISWGCWSEGIEIEWKRHFFNGHRPPRCRVHRLTGVWGSKSKQREAPFLGGTLITKTTSKMAFMQTWLEILATWLRWLFHHTRHSVEAKVGKRAWTESQGPGGRALWGQLSLDTSLPLRKLGLQGLRALLQALLQRRGTLRSLEIGPKGRLTARLQWQIVEQRFLVFSIFLGGQYGQY